jgi:hypothetical protein
MNHSRLPLTAVRVPDLIGLLVRGHPPKLVIHSSLIGRADSGLGQPWKAISDFLAPFPSI